MHAAPVSRRRFYLAHLWLPLAGAALMLLPLEATQLDHVVSDWFFDAATGRFPLQYNALFEIVTHQWAKYVVVLIACGMVAIWLLSFVAARLRPRRQLLLFLSLALALAPATVSAIRATSSKHCPYDLVEYGGYVPYRGLFEGAPQDEPRGRCFPSSHASAGFCLLAFYFAGRALGSRRLALAGLWGGLAAGMLFGLARVAQGAHFLSHNLWSGLVCWLVILALYVAIIGPADGVPAPANTGEPRAR